MTDALAILTGAGNAVTTDADGTMHVHVPNAVLALVMAGLIRPGGPMGQVFALWRIVHDLRLGRPVVFDMLWSDTMGGKPVSGLQVYSPPSGEGA